MDRLPKDVKHYLIIHFCPMHDLLQWRGLFGVNNEWRKLIANVLATVASREAQSDFCFGFYSYRRTYEHRIKIGNWDITQCKRFISWLEPESCLSAAIFLKTYLRGLHFPYLYPHGKSKGILGFGDVITRSCSKSTYLG